MNEKIRQINEAFLVLTDTYTIACECSDLHCTAMLSIEHEEYADVRVDARLFIVCPDHVDRGLERVVLEDDRFAVVEPPGVTADLVGPEPAQQVPLDLVHRAA